MPKLSPFCTPLRTFTDIGRCIAAQLARIQSGAALTMELPAEAF
jgi:hypothetical protein